MKKIRIVLIVAMFVVGAGIVFADHQQEACSPNAHHHGSLHIAWIACQSNDDEVIVIMNGAAHEVDLTDYEITSSGGQRFVFQSEHVNPQCCIIQPYDVLRIHSGPRNSSFFEDSRDLHWLREDGQPLTSNIWVDSGDTAQLIDFRGDLIDTYEY